MATGKQPSGKTSVPEINNICVQVGRRIREFRTARGWTQQMLADHAQIERAHLARLEDGKREAGLLILDKIANALDIKPAELLIVIESKGLTFKPRKG